MSQIRTIDFLPEIFKTEANRKIISSTLDHLVQDPDLRVIQGFVGRRAGDTSSYLEERDSVRQNYQLEPAITFRRNSTVEEVQTYPEIIDALALAGSDVSDQGSLFAEEYYAWDSYVDLDKLVNYQQYYWVPDGLDAVTISATAIPTDQLFTFAKDTAYRVNGELGANPTITLVRGGTYRFSVNQPGSPFYIQAQPGTDGTMPYASNISSRTVYGVTNNGEDFGEVLFAVPSSTGQQEFSELLEIAPIDLITDLRFDQINNVKLSAILDKYTSIDGITSFNGLTIVFKNQFTGWVDLGEFDPTGDGYLTPDPLISSEIPEAARSNAWEMIEFQEAGETYVRLVTSGTIPVQSKFKISYGTENGNLYYYKNSVSQFATVPLITATLDTLYYQDGTNPELFGEIRLVDSLSEEVLDVETDIIGKDYYTAGNAVALTNGLKVVFGGAVTPDTYRGREFVVEGVGKSITLTPWENFVLPENYVNSDLSAYDQLPYDTLGYNQSLNAPLDPDYIVMNRASIENSGWARINRWYHADTILMVAAATGESNFAFDAKFKAKRPIIEFRKNIQLFDFGAVSVGSVNIIDFDETDALSDIHGSSSYSYDGYALRHGTRVIFANDADPDVRNKIYTVSFEDLQGDGVYTLVLQQTLTVENNSSVLCLNGTVQQGKSYKFKNNTWDTEQEKFKLNQFPLFDIVDSQGVSFSEFEGSTFSGSKLFNYAVGTGARDSILDFPLKYKNIGTFADTQFDNFYFTDTFQLANSQTAYTRDGLVKENDTQTTFRLSNGWQTGTDQLVQPQVFNFASGGKEFKIAFVAALESTPTAKVFIDNSIRARSEYTVTHVGDTVTVTLNTETTLPVTVHLQTSTVSVDGYFKIPSSLEKNPFNETPADFTLGSIRSQFLSAVENHPLFIGNAIGANNARDLGDFASYADFIIQHSAPIATIAPFISSDSSNLFESIRHAAREYDRAKIRILEAVAREEWIDQSPRSILDEVLQQVSSGRRETSPFYWSDMCPSGVPSNERSFTITALSGTVFPISFAPDFTKANYKSVLVYLDDALLIKDQDYAIVNSNVNVSATMEVGQVLTIAEYQETYGNFIPETPTKIGAYSKFVPAKFVDNSYRTPQTVIRGHDGSITIAFNDIRDDVLLELETRIYNNLKVVASNELRLENVLNGQYRDTGISKSAVTNIISDEFLEWAGWQRIDYRVQEFDNSDPFTYNYSGSKSNIDNTMLTGSWRAVFFDLYDTDAPDTRPWEMLGISIKPTWWDAEYGVAPYTSGNTLLWEDLAAGLIKDPANTRIDSRFARPGLVDFIPVDTLGNIRSPLDFLVNSYRDGSFNRSWLVGEMGATETAWRRSSAWPFVVQKILALLKPAQYMNAYLNTDEFARSVSLGQYLGTQNQRISVRDVTITEGTAMHSFLNWVFAYGSHIGASGAETVADKFKNIDAQLAYRVAGFTDKKFLRIINENSSPGVSSPSLIIPEESYQLVLHKNEVFDKKTYSAVNVQKVNGGYSVAGYNNTRPFFLAYAPIYNGVFKEFVDGDSTLKVARDFSEKTTRVPYGAFFPTADSLCNFLLGYGLWLENNGFEFNTQEDGIVQNWERMARECFAWTKQNWPTGSIISINPIALEAKLNFDFGVIESLNSRIPSDIIVSQNKQQIKISNTTINRAPNSITVATDNDDTIAYLNFKFASVEHIIVFDNQSVFDDVLFSPVTGARVPRLILSGYKTNNWAGRLETPGFILNTGVVSAWQPNMTYTRGEIVEFKNKYWSAVDTVLPSENFDYNQWFPSDFDQSKKGLLPSPAAKAKIAEDFYNVNVANLEQDADLFALGLIGFRPREYMRNLGLDDVAQVKLYSNLIKSKGSVESARVLNQGRFGDQAKSETFNLFENWAIHRGYYGANANRRFVDLMIESDSATSNPFTVALVDGTEEAVNQNILVGDIYNKSMPVTSPNMFSLIAEKNYDTLPIAGFVNFDDVDLAIFELSELGSTQENLDSVGDGAIIWVAKTNTYDWNVFRAQSISVILTSVQDNLDGTATLRFDQNHNLRENSMIVVKNFSPEVDNAYVVKKVINRTEITIEFSYTGNKTNETGNGVVFALKQAKVAQPSDIGSLNPHYISKNKVWVTENENQKWSMIERTNSMSVVTTAANPTDFESGSNNSFGTSVAQTADNQFVFVGDTVTGLVTVFKNTGAALEFWQTLESPTDEQKFGHAIACASNNRVIVSAIGSPTQHGQVVVFELDTNQQFQAVQVITNTATPVGGQFGYAIAVSANEDWLFVTEPENARVYAFLLGDSGYEVTDIITDSALGFGAAIATTQDGKQILVGCPLETVGDCVRSGRVKAFNQFARRFIVDSDTYEIDTDFVVRKAYVNGVEQDPLLPLTVAIGDIVEVMSGQFDVANQNIIDSDNHRYDARFGSSMAFGSGSCEIFVGSPNSSVSLVGSGIVERFLDNQKFSGIAISADVTTALSSGSMLINYYEVEFAGGTVQQLANTINTASIPNISAGVTDNKLIISVVNHSESITGNRLCILPATGTLVSELGFEGPTIKQLINNPQPQNCANFGHAIQLSPDSVQLLISATEANSLIVTDFEAESTDFDNDSTHFIDTVASGVVYSYDWLPNKKSSIDQVGEYVIGEQVVLDEMIPNEYFGSAISYVDNILVVTSTATPIYEKDGQTFTNQQAIDQIILDVGIQAILANLIDTSVIDPTDYGYTAIQNAGRVSVFQNANRVSSWKTVREETGQVDTKNINAIALVDPISNNVLADLDFIDPIQGKILGVAQQNIDIIGAVDPVNYDNGEWGNKMVGMIWWDTSTTRFVDYYQSSIDYNAKRWGQQFPGSEVLVYEWVASDVAPADYAGETAFDNRFIVKTELNSANIFETKYYFWAKNVATVNTSRNKTLSVETIARYIESPISSGIPFAALIKPNAFALYNCNTIIRNQDCLIHLDFEKTYTESNIHSEFELFAENNPSAFIGDTLYNKLLDSFCGVDRNNSPVPATGILFPENSGTLPMQSMFRNRLGALQTFFEFVNTQAALVPIAEYRQLKILSSYDLPPVALDNLWDKQLATKEELEFQDFALAGIGYRYLVLNDESRSNKWAIYTLNSQLVPVVTQSQTFDSRDYWSFVDWYDPSISRSVRVVKEVQTEAALSTVDAYDNIIVKVKQNVQGLWEIYQYVENNWKRVALQNGTIEFNSRLWTETNIPETRSIIDGIRKELFVGELSYLNNRWLTLMFNYILSEYPLPGWIFKTSLVDIENVVSQLGQYRVYRNDYQDSIVDYFTEAKPYHTKIKDYIVRYDQVSQLNVSATDFDCPAYFNTELNRFISPVLDNTGLLSPSSLPSNADIWKQTPWEYWYNNRGLCLKEILIHDGGIGYDPSTKITIVGNNSVAATAQILLDAAGSIDRVTVIDSGGGYTATPEIVITSATGENAKLVAVMEPCYVRNFNTIIKFDRYDVFPLVSDWKPNTAYKAGDMIRTGVTAFRALNDIAPAATLELDLYERIDEADLGALDRTAGYYAPRPNMIGRDLALLIRGIDYLENRVTGLDFTESGYVTSVFDTYYSTAFTDEYVGTLVTDINVDGSGFVDTFSSHSPEELMPGITYDALDLRVYAVPGVERRNLGHGFVIQTEVFVYDGTDIVLGSNYEHISGFYVFNRTTGVSLTENTDYVIDWAPRIIEFNSGATVTNGDIIGVTFFGVGGGNQLYKQSSVFGEIPSSIVSMPIDFQTVDSALVMVNGVVAAEATYLLSGDDLYTEVELLSALNADDWVTVILFGVTAENYDYAIPVVEEIQTTGGLAYSLNTALNGTNIVDAIVELDGIRLQPPVSVEYLIQDDDNIVYDLPVFKTDKVFRVISRSNSSTSHPAPDGVYTEQGIRIASHTGSYTVAVFNRASGELATVRSFPVSANSAQAALMADFLFSLNNDKIVVIFTAIDARANRLLGNLPAAIKRCGGSTAIFESDFKIGSAYMLIGVPGSQEGNGIEYYKGAVNNASDAWIDVAFHIRDGNPELLGQNYTGFEVITEDDILIFINDQEVDPEYYDLNGAESVNIYATLNPLDKLKIAITKRAEYMLSDTSITIDSSVTVGSGSVLRVISWNDARQQGIQNFAFDGNTITEVRLVDYYDTIKYSFIPDLLNAEDITGGFDFDGYGYLPKTEYSIPAVDSNRIWVTLNGARLIYGTDFTLDNGVINIIAPVGADDTIIVTVFARDTVGEFYSFRLFSDMNQTQAIFKMNQTNTTVLGESLGTDGDVVISDITKIYNPSTAFDNRYGVIIVGAERITYTGIDTETNTLIGVRRGTAGTAIVEHAAGDTVTDCSDSSFLQNSIPVFVSVQVPEPGQAPITLTGKFGDVVVISDSSTVEFDKYPGPQQPGYFKSHRFDILEDGTVTDLSVINFE